MNQKVLYAVFLIVVIILFGMWMVRGTGNDRSPDDGANVATTTGATSTVISAREPVFPYPATDVSGRTKGVLPDGRYQLDTTESSVTWIGRKPRILGYEDTGTFALSEGTLEVRNGHVAGGEFTIDIASLSVTSTGKGEGNDMLKNHLLSDDFFGAETYPEATFAILDVTNGVVTGNLTIKGVTKMISFPAAITAESASRLVADTTLTLDRTDWDVRYGSGSFFQDLGDNLIADEVDITLHLVASK